MRVLYVDVDSLRPDHLGCYGYHRNTSPRIDEVAGQGIRFERCFVPDAPCLPSRTALMTGRFGIHTGVVNHGGLAADMRPLGNTRPFGAHDNEKYGWIMSLRKAGLHTATISSFAERHAAWWYYEGFQEIINTGIRGVERADVVIPHALQWLDQKGRAENWFLHVQLWDAHTPYQAPSEYGNPFRNDPPPAWLTDDLIAKHYRSYGPHSAHDPLHEWDGPVPTARMVSEIKNRSDYKTWIDGYDTGIRYLDDHFGLLIDKLKQMGVFEDTVIVISADHGENQGELNVYGDHQTADFMTTRVPMIVKLPGNQVSRVNSSYYYQGDIAATLTLLAGGQANPHWDVQPFPEALSQHPEAAVGRDHLVVSQCAWSCQRAVVFDEHIYIRTYHPGLKDFPQEMLFDIQTDPHEVHNLAGERPELVNKGRVRLGQWHKEMLSNVEDGTDPMDVVLQEGGPFHTRGALEAYCDRLRRTGRDELARLLMERGM